MALVLTFCNRMQISYELMQHLLVGLVELPG